MIKFVNYVKSQFNLFVKSFELKKFLIVFGVLFASVLLFYYSFSGWGNTINKSVNDLSAFDV